MWTAQIETCHLKNDTKFRVKGGKVDLEGVKERSWGEHSQNSLCEIHKEISLKIFLK